MQPLPANTRINLKTGGFRLSRLSEAGFNDINQLHAAVYGDEAPEGYYAKKYLTAFTGIGLVGFIAYNDSDTPVAYYGVVPCFLCVEAQKVLAAQSVDTMTHPEYRNKGLFVMLANLTFGLCHELGIRVVFGFPNQNSLPGFINKLGWRTAERMDCFIIPVKTLPLEKIAGKFPFLKKIVSKHTSRVLKNILSPMPGIESSVFADGFGGVLRDKDYLQNKTYSATQVIRLDEVFIWIKTCNGLIIGDMLGVNEQNFVLIMGKLKQLAKSLGLTQLQFQTSLHTSLHLLFAQHYQAKPSFPVIFKDIGGDVKTDKIKFTFADIDIF